MPVLTAYMPLAYHRIAYKCVILWLSYGTTN
jgi:hypothetical protein